MSPEDNPCPECDGLGWFDNLDDDDLPEDMNCSNCNGTGIDPDACDESEGT